MPSYPTRGTEPWDNPLKDYIDTSIPPAVAAAVAASPTVANAAAAAVAGVVAGQKIVLWNKMPTLFTNYVRNPGAEVDLTDWSDFGGHGERDTSIHRFGSASIKVTPGTTDYSGVALGGFQGLVTAGNPYTIAFWVYTPKALTSINLSADWMEPGYTSNLTRDNFGGVNLPIGFTRVIIQGIAATGGNPQHFRRTVVAAGTQDPFWVDGVTVTDGFTVPDFFDGDSPGCFWLGTAHASASVKAAYVKDEVLDVYKMPVLGRNEFTNPMFRPSPDRHFGGNATLTQDGTILGRRSVRAHRANTDPGGMYVGQTMYLAAGLWTLTAWGRLVSGSSVIYPTVFKEDFSENYSTSGSGNAPTLVTYEDRLITQQFTIPAGGRLVLILFDQGKPGTDPWTTNDVFDIGGVMVTPGTAPVSPTDLVVGSDPGSRWLGVPENSPSVRLLPTREQTLINAPELARNLARNPRPQIGPWRTETSASTLTIGDVVLEGARAARLQMNGGTYEILYTSSFYAEAGKRYRYALSYQRDSGQIMAVNVVKPDGAYYSSHADTGAIGPAVTWDEFVATATGVHYVIVQNYNGPTAGVTHVGPVQVTEVPSTSPDSIGLNRPTKYPTDYFDGSTPGCRWTGAVNDSASVKMLASKADSDMLVWLDAGRARGIGSPEGRVLAPVGARYVDTKGALADGGMGAIEWTKMSGAGATGWKVTVGDTGWRKIITAGAVTNNPGLSVAIQRVNSEVTAISTDSANAVSASFQVLASLAAGFRPPTDPAGMVGFVPGIVYDQNGRPVAGAGIYAESGGNLVLTPNAGVRHFVVLKFTTRDAWPTVLPGTPS